MHLTWKQRLTGRVADSPPRALSYSPLTLDLWQRSPERVDWARRAFNDPLFRDMLAVLASARPHAATNGADPTSAAIALGRREGFDLLLGVMHALTQDTPKPPVEVEANYGAENFSLD